MVAVKLADRFSLSVKEVMEILDCDENTANLVMHDISLMEIGSWNTTTGELDYNFDWGK